VHRISDRLSTMAAQTHSRIRRRGHMSHDSASEIAYRIKIDRKRRLFARSDEQSRAFMTFSRVVLTPRR
jgi:hypothetical protein